MKQIFFLFVVIYVAVGDPCVYHKNLTNVEIRGTGCQKVPSLICDKNNFDTGWYAAIHEGRYLQMPDFKQLPNSFACGTESPIWINNNPANTIVHIAGCVRAFDHPCKVLYPITIKKCPLFYVYHLPRVDSCFQGYCFGNHTCGNRPPITTTPITTTTPPAVGDPCVYHRILTNVEIRGTGCQKVPSLICDKNNFNTGWYAAIHEGRYLQMPDYKQVPNSFACGTESPIWINSSHPTVVGQIVHISGCVRAFDHPCKVLYPITIKKCPLFYVYHLPQVDSCFQGYCFGSHTCGNRPPITTPPPEMKSDITILIVIALAAHGIVLVVAAVVAYFIKRRKPKIDEPPPPYSPRLTYDCNTQLINGYPQDKTY